MNLELSEKDQTLFDLLICIPPKMEEAERFLQEEKLSVEEITRVGIRYADDCFCDLGDHIAMLNPEVDYDLRGIETPYGTYFQLVFLFFVAINVAIQIIIYIT